MYKFIIIFFVFFLAACIKNEPDQKRLYKQAQIKFKNGQLDSAIYFYGEMLKIDSTYAGVYADIGYIMSVKKDYQNAIYNIKKAIILDPNNYIPYYNLSGIYKNMRENDSAKVWIEKALALKPNDRENMIRKGEICGALRELDTALKIFNELIALDKKDPEGYIGRGGTYGMMELHDKEIEDYKMAIELDTAGKTEALVNIAYTYHYAKKDDAKACQYLKLAQEKINYKPTEQELKDFCGETSH